MVSFPALEESLRREPRSWLVTGAGGFIGSHLVESLLHLSQKVVGLDNFATGKRANLEEVSRLVSLTQWKQFHLIEGDICRLDVCQRAVEGCDYILHQAALGSVPRSISDPGSTHRANVDGFLNVLLAARDQKAKRFVYASSSAVYGDLPDLPKREDKIGHALSPYAVSKRMNELYADIFARCYGMETIGLRYFNVFGQRQDPEGAYAAVIPRWIAALMRGEVVQVNGDGETSRDFCYVANIVQANLLAATVAEPAAVNRVYNVALNQRTTLNDLFALLRDGLAVRRPALRTVQPAYREFRAGDVLHSQADISLARRLLGYSPRFQLSDGLRCSLEWYETNIG